MIDSLVRPSIRKLVPYTSARHLYQDGLLLDANENPFGSVVRLPLALSLNRYPDPYSKSLKSALSKFLKTSADHLFIGVGSDEIIDLLIRLFVSPDEEVLICEPTYGMYRVAADIAGVKVKSCLLDSDFQLDLKRTKDAITAKTKLIFCCSPNNPTGNLLNPNEIKALCKGFKGVVVVDEAYIEFATRPSILGKVKELDNLVVLRTFSKAWGLAGVRVGYAITNPQVVEYLNKIKPPYNISAVSAFLAKRALSSEKTFRRWKDEIVKERARLTMKFKALGFEVFPSQANFILIRGSQSSSMAKKLASKYRIIVRDVSTKPGLSNCLRISVGTPNQNSRLLKAMGEVA